MRTILIVGGARGIGRALVDAYVAAGDRVFVTARGPLAIDGAVVLDGVELTDDAACLALPGRLRALGVDRVDVVVVNAGILTREHLPDLLGPDRAAAFAGLQTQWEVNALGPLRVATALLPMLGAGSRLGVVSSRRGSVGDNSSGGSYGYRMSKAAVNMAFVNLARDLAPRGIAVVVLHPGFVQTDLTGGRGDVTAAEAAAGLAARIDATTLENSGGGFMHANGETLPW